MVFASTDKNKEALENYTELWDEVEDQIKIISSDNPIEYEKDLDLNQMMTYLWVKY